MGSVYSLRTKETQDQYDELRRQGHLEKGCPLCAETALETFTYWKIIPNKFPYDRVARVHHMLIPLRHVIEQELTPEEKEELIAIKNTKLPHYDILVEALPHKKSIPSHFHLHLLVPKDEI